MTDVRICSQQWMGSGDLKINEVGGGDTGKNLVKATSAGWLQVGSAPHILSSLPPNEIH